ncbi:MAG: DUF4129 domain-containing protein [Actinomycetota bacterium]|nr:DUF4129 domain-containing protein [Actinomycetota bacterium]
MSERRSWRVLAIAGLLGLVGVVAVAAAGRAPGGGESRPSGHPPTLIADYVGTLALLIVPAGALVVVWMMFMRRAEQVRTGTRTQGIWLSGVIVGLIALGLLLAAGSHFGWHPFSSKGPGTGNTPGAVTPGKTVPPDQQQRELKAHFRWLPVFVLGSFVFALGGSVGLLAWRRRHHGLPPVSPAVALSEALGETLDDLRNEPDPRKAVIGAYARMERALAARGMPREAFEAPIEYLVRILDFVQASAHSVRRLTRLFERARFSPHEIDARMKDDAIDALAGLRAELEAAL